MRLSKGLLFLVLLCLVVPISIYAKKEKDRDRGGGGSSLRIISPPSSYRFDSFYKKFLLIEGIPIISSQEIRDEAFYKAAPIISNMLSPRPDVRDAMVRLKSYVIIIGARQQLTDIPEYRDLYRDFPGVDWNERARGLGATPGQPVTSVGEENLLRLSGDRYQGESVLVHEFAHSMSVSGFNEVDRNFEDNLESLYNRQKRLWSGTYAAENSAEYWAEGLQSYFDCNLESNRPDGIHNRVNTRDELKRFDRELFNLIDGAFKQTRWRFPSSNQALRLANSKSKTAKSSVPSTKIYNKEDRHGHDTIRYKKKK